ncbi:hypothetical protein [Deinococcus humi]|uniref:Uncharacterized protein n=1 Tax=Deinococcus humi TaxID=662880 RepID=A0A7W8K0N6_9DEIO|nr:hypothetical protein [Deinococcus humi]MBB5366338.1 hypothetical protein [Deinococcus humi]
MTIPAEVKDAFLRFSTAANRGDRGTHPLDQDRFYSAVQIAYGHGADMDIPEFDELMQAQGWASADARRELADRFLAAYKMLRYERTGSTFNRG